MKTIFRIIVLVSIIQSCSFSNKEKDKLIGNWSTVNGNSCPLEYQFCQDSIRFSEMCYSHVNSWYINDSKIYHTNIKDSFANRNYVFDYKISNNNDTLFIKSVTDSLYKFPILRVKNGFDYLLKNLRLTFDLPSKNDLISSKENGIGFNVYVGFRNGKLIAKTDSDKTRGLDEIKYETIAFLAYQETELDSTNFQFNLLVDKNISKTKIDSIKNILKSTGYSRIFRVYNNEQVDYEKTDWKDELNWFGVYE
ncbi:hypothetical protein [uncultured Algibacter sp.]|uniref:hypothetical protein n=1 Tax=uncultured Algibacter sp. TaxID=298659 RepID=UPI003216286B